MNVLSCGAVCHVCAAVSFSVVQWCGAVMCAQVMSGAAGWCGVIVVMLLVVLVLLPCCGV